MVDLFDQASDTEALFLRAAQEKRKPILMPFGFCHYCSSPIPQGVFCDIGCSQDYENEMAAKKRNGTEYET